MEIDFSGLICPALIVGGSAVACCAIFHDMLIAYLRATKL